MSVKVNYKGSQIATVGPQQTKTLDTAGTWCEDDFTLVDDSNPTAEENDVIFIDYDGTIRYSYTADEFLALTALPPNPVHKGLVAEGWNWTLNGAQSYVSKYGICNIGQNLNTDDGTSRFWVTISDSVNLRTYVNFYQSKSEGVSINWGDGSAAERFSGSGNKNVYHDWPAVGTYKIVFTIDNDCTVKLGGPSYGMFTPGNIGTADKYYVSQLDAVNLGNRVTGFVRDTFYSAFLKSISIPRSLTNFDAIQIFRNTGRLKAVVFPPNSKVTGSYMFTDSSGIEYLALPEICGNHHLGTWFAPKTLFRRINLPETITVLDSQYTFFSNAVISKLILPEGLQNISQLCVRTCHGLQSLKIPSSVTAIGVQAFYDCLGMREMIFAPTSPPNIVNSDAWTNFPTTCILYVPFSSLAAYLTATNYPSPATYTYIGFATYESGVTLPTQDSTQAYNVVWYASKADSIAESNPITTGNGKEIYCRYTAV